MDRRSSRGRPIPEERASASPPRRGVARRGGGKGGGITRAPPPRSPSPVVIPPPRAKAMTPVLVPPSEVPSVGSEEVVLNRRGMPARQRKKNKFYFDDNMITPEKWGAAIARNQKKVKAEPVEVEEESSSSDGENYDEIPVPPPISNGSPKRRAVPSPVKGFPVTKKPAPAKKPEPRKSTGRQVVAQQAKSPQRGGRQPTLQLLQQKSPSPDRSPRTSKSAKATASKATPVKLSPAKLKRDPDGTLLVLPPPPEPVNIPPRKKKSIDSDPWGKTVQRAKNLERDREERQALKSNGVAVSERRGSQKKAKRDSLLLSDEAESARKSVKREPGVPVSPEEDRLEKERLQKEKRLAQQKKKREQQQQQDLEAAAAILPPPPPIVVQQLLPKLSTPFLTTIDEDQLRYQAQQVAQQQVMAVLKINEAQTQQAMDRRVAHELSIRLRNLLKLPKAHKWVCYEWFYSNIDKVLFEGENDFQVCLKESFPNLKSRKLTRVEWTKIRRLMGKPRRCSQAFFDEEREELSRRRQKIRQIQQRKVTDFNHKELPDEIPLQLVIGTKVTARLRRPQDGIFTGTIEGVDTSNNTYRINFDRPGLGTHSIPDSEVLSNDPVETVSTSSFALKIPRRPGGITEGKFKFQNPALLNDQPDGLPKSLFPPDGMLGGFPIRLLDMIVRLSKLLKAKREKIMTLKELNVEAEKMKSYGKRYGAEYRRRYARCVADLDSMNKEMGMYLERIQIYCLEITNDSGSTTQMIVPEQVLEGAKQEAGMIVSTYNCKANRTLVHNQKIQGLVQQLTSLLLQVRTLSTSDRNLYELRSLKDSLVEIKASLEGKNLQCFQNKIEIPMNRILAGLCVSQPKTF